jgi:hypothetical protein
MQMLHNLWLAQQSDELTMFQKGTSKTMKRGKARPAGVDLMTKARVEWCLDKCGMDDGMMDV